MILKRKNNIKKISITDAFSEDIKYYTRKIKFKHKDNNGEIINTDYCNMIKIEDLKKIIEEHFGFDYENRNSSNKEKIIHNKYSKKKLIPAFFNKK